jgi:hypothetical protein
MTFSIGVVLLLVVIAGILSILALLQNPRGLVFLAVGELLLAIALLIEHAPH